MTKNMIAVAAATILIMGCSSTSPSKTRVSGPVKGNASYLVGSNHNKGNIILSGRGQCIKGRYKKDEQILDCDPDAKMAADKMAADKMAADKMAADKMAADKMAADKMAADKMAADKMAADKAAAAAAAKPIIMSMSGKALFGSGSAKLSANGMTALGKLKEQLGSYKKIDSLTVIGHSDSMGSAAGNKALSAKRAIAVRNEIVQSGVAEGAQITVIGMGEEQPIASNETAEGRQQNRRVEIEVRGEQ